jgi:uncharacterized protein YqgC (DUF456 family)
MVETLTVVAVALLVAGVAGSLLPLVPGPLLSVAGVCLHWWATDYTEPSLVVFVALVLVGLFALVVDLLAGAISARAGGASWRTSALATVVGIVLFVAGGGPAGLLVGIAGTVFALEFYTHGDRDASLKAAAFATVGVLGSGVVQALLTGSMLAAFLLVLAF